MIIHVLCTDGSPLGVTEKTIYGDRFQIGVGGAELALLTMCGAWEDAGHDVVLYNNPREPGASKFDQRTMVQFNPKDKRDVLIVFRSTNAKAVAASGYKVWWSCDQYTTGMFKEFAPFMDKIVVISPFHKKYFEDFYGINNTVVTDLPVRTDEYKGSDFVKSKYKFLFSSVPDRGLDALWRMWPIIKRNIPEATVTITSDYRLWGAGSPMNDRYRKRWIVYDDFSFLGAVSRNQLVSEQLKSGIMAYPCTYEELFCISVAEAQCAGVYTVTTNAGSLPTTNMCTVVNWDALDPRGDEHFVEILKSTLDDPNFDKRIKDIQTKAMNRFDPKTILKHWEDNIFG